MRGNKTSLTTQTEEIIKTLNKKGIYDISLGIIIPIRGRRDHHIRIKCSPLSGALLLHIVGKKYKQEIRIYGNHQCKDIATILKREKNENFIFQKQREDF